MGIDTRWFHQVPDDKKPNFYQGAISEFIEPVYDELKVEVAEFNATNQHRIKMSVRRPNWISIQAYILDEVTINAFETDTDQITGQPIAVKPMNDEEKLAVSDFLEGLGYTFRNLRVMTDNNGDSSLRYDVKPKFEKYFEIWKERKDSSDSDGSELPEMEA